MIGMFPYEVRGSRLYMLCPKGRWNLPVNQSIHLSERKLEVICFLRREFRELAKRSVGQLGRFVVSGERREVQNRRVFVGRSGEVGS